MANASGNYTVIVDGQKFNVTIAEGNDANIQVTPVSNTTSNGSCNQFAQVLPVLQMEMELKFQLLLMVLFGKSCKRRKVIWLKRSTNYDS